MSDASKDIAAQFAAAGVVPGQLVPQGGVAKAYVDAQDAALQAGINAVSTSAGTANQIANQANTTAGQANSAAAAAQARAEQAFTEAHSAFGISEQALTQAQKNAAPSFNRVNDIEALDVKQQFFIVAGVGITVTTDPVTKKITITATGTSTPGAHASSHLTGGSDQIPLATADTDGLASKELVKEVADARISAAYSQTFASLDARLENTEQHVNGREIIISAPSDGTTDAYPAFAAAVSAAQAGDTLVIPVPVTTYRMSQSWVIPDTKPLRIKGPGSFVGLTYRSTLTFDAAVLTGIEVKGTTATLADLSLTLKSTSASVVAGIYLSAASASGNANTTIENVFIRFSHTSGAGVKGKNVITSKFKNVKTYQGAWGFYFDTAGTSLMFDSCWSMSSTVGGYYLASYEYCAYINCACDSPNNPEYAYHIVNSNGVTFTSCGAENIGKTMFKFDGGSGITAVSCRAIGMNVLGTAKATFAELLNGAKNVTFIGCMETATTLANLSITGIMMPIIVNCAFPRIEVNGTTTIENFANNGSLKIGGLNIYESPFGAAASIVNGKEFLMGGKRIGVATADASAYLGYIDADGGIVPAAVTLPTASASYRGKMFRVQGGTGAADALYVCQKNASEGYIWTKIG